MYDLECKFWVKKCGISASFKVLFYINLPVVAILFVFVFYYHANMHVSATCVHTVILSVKLYTVDDTCIWYCRGTVRHEKANEGNGREKCHIYERDYEFARGKTVNNVFKRLLILGPGVGVGGGGGEAKKLVQFFQVA